MTTTERMSRAWAAWERFWFAPQPAHRIVLLRILAPLAILGLMSSRLWHYDELFTAEGFHVPDLGGGLVNQPLHFQPIGDNAALVISILLVAAGLAVCLGYRTRIATALFALLLGYASLFDRVSAVSVNKLGTTIMVALCFCPAGTAFSLDRRRERRLDPGVRQPETIPGTVIRFLQVQLAVMYCASGVCKMRGDWLDSGYVLWSQIHGHYQTAFAYWVGRAMPVWGWPALQICVLCFEAGAPLLLSWRPTRRFSVGFGIAMHLCIGLLFRRLLFFSSLMISLLTLFLSDDVQLAVLRLPQRIWTLVRPAPRPA